MAELEIKVGANVAGAISGLNQVQDELNQTGRAASQLGNEVEKASAKILKLPSTVNQATFTLNNFTRVVQDAPYGIRGVANNIDPLVESFTRLRAQTGSAGLAFRAMLSTLAGPAGILLTVSTVTSALTFFGDKLADTGKKGKDAFAELAQGLSTDLVQLTSIIGLAQNTAASTNDRTKALELLNKEYAKYLPNLQGELITLGNINEAYVKIVDSLLRQAVVKGLQEEIAKAVQETAKQIVALSIAQEKERLALEKGAKSAFEKISSDTKLAQIANDKNKAIKDGVIAFNQQTQAERAAIGTTNVYAIQIDALKKQLFETLAPALNLAKAFEDLDKKLKPGKLEIDFGLIPGIRFLTKFLIAEAAKFPLDEILNEEFEKQLKKSFAKPKEVKIPLRFNFVQSVQDFKDLQAQNEKNLEATLQAINQALANIQIGALSSIGEAIGAALAGGDIGNAFETFANVLASGLDAIGKQLVTVGGLAKLTKEALASLFAKPALAIAAGIGLIAAASALRASISDGVQFRALGGPVKKDDPYIVGEKGPELFIPNQSGTIIPNNRVREFTNNEVVESDVPKTINKITNSSIPLTGLFNNNVSQSLIEPQFLELFNLSNITARALGGIVNLGQQYLVGERGPELFVPSVDRTNLFDNDVSSFGQGLATMMGGRGGGGTTLRGQDIILAYARTQRSQLRVNG
jgi:hypothetical protein